VFRRFLRPRKIVRLILALVVLYLAAGYVIPRVHWVSGEPAIGAAAYGIPQLAPAGVRVAGALHAHTQRSHDALGTESEVARAARAADLDFVIIADHRPADAPESLWRTQVRYEEGVLLVRGQEISLGGDVGRVLVFGLDTVMTYWDRGPEEFGALLERQGATAVVAHSRSVRTHDRWYPRDAPGITGWEVFDLADIGRVRLADKWVAYHLLALVASAPLGRTHESLLRLHRGGFEQPGVAAFDSLYPLNRFTALGGLDAHPKQRIGDRLVPGYGPFFKSIANHIELMGPLPGDSRPAMAALAEGLRAGRAFISFGNTELARNFVLQVVASGHAPVGIGRPVPLVPELYLRAGFWGGPSTRLVYRVVRDGEHRAWVPGAELAWPLTEPGIYRVEVYRYTLRVGPLVWNMRPWIFANPTWVVQQAE
jgi:hypothetical protein